MFYNSRAGLCRTKSTPLRTFGNTHAVIPTREWRGGGGQKHVQLITRFPYPEQKICFLEWIFTCTSSNWLGKGPQYYFFCTIDSKLRSFYFKICHKAIALNDFLFKIKRKDSPNCSLCDKKEETMVHLFCECEKGYPSLAGPPCHYFPE